MSEQSQITEKLSSIERLLKQIVALQMHNNGAKQDDIARSLSVSKTYVNVWLQGVKRGNDHGETNATTRPKTNKENS